MPRGRGLAVGLATLAAALAAVPAASAASTTGVAGYAIGQRLCPAPTPGRAECLADRRVQVPIATPGARPFKLAAGADAHASTIGPAGGLTPGDFATAYSFSSTATGTGQTVAIVDAYDDPTIEADLQVFDSNYGLLACTTANGCFTKVNQTGTSSPLPPENDDWAGEIALDVETVHSICQKCKIVLVEATDDTFANLEAAEDEAVALHATEITNSYGGAATPSSTDLAAYNHPGVVITASAADDGYYDYDLYSLGENGTSPALPAFPAAANTVVAVGGTSLYLDQTGNRQSETVWNDNGAKDYDQELTDYNLGAGGGGCSATIPAQPWQTGMGVWASTACGTHRLVADVSADADYLTGFDTYDTTGGSGWGTIGGTSLSSPLIAAMYALAGGAHGLSYPALTLYGNRLGTSVYDVTSGGNGWCDGAGAAECGDPNTLGDGVLDCDYPATGSTPAAGDRACDALVGYDGPTGVGTPNTLGLFAPTGPKPVLTGPASVVHGVSNTWSASGSTDPFPNGLINKYVWNWGDGTTTTTTTGSAAHTYTATGTHTITLTESDNYFQSGSVTKSVTVS